MLEKAALSRKRALGYAEKLIEDPKYKDQLKESYLIAGAMRYFLEDYKNARRDFEKGKAVPFHNNELTAEDEKSTEEYLNALIDEFLESQCGQIDMLLAIDSGRQQKAAELLDRYPELVKKTVHLKPTVEIVTFLHFAVRKGKGEIAKLLIAKGADVNARDEKGNTPLFEACQDLPGETQSKDLIKLLLDKGADINARNSKGKTLLHNAVLSGNDNEVKLLLSLGADGSIKDKSGNTPLRYAKKYELKNIIQILQDNGVKE
ncbi:MAG: ankyrin repeat domain-containing protein [Candidatus Eremiobacteraeota bacterium]|nr:ankyrin repeat domain-containing protein [Candidatus Eremiobacteraeota bacterium]